MNNAYDRVTEALQRQGCTNKGNDWTCPHHKDGGETNPSLSVTEGGKGAILHCHAGCSVEDVAQSIGLKTSDLFNEPLKREKFRETDRYDYVGESGELLFQVIKKIGDETGEKTFSQRHLENNNWVWNLKGVRRVLYRLPQVIEAAAAGKTIYIVEGEKDVGAIERAGGVATCNPGGAGKWREEYNEFFHGANVIVVRDKDDPGLRHARNVIDNLTGIASCMMLEPKEGKDVSDHLVAGYTLTELLPASIEVQPEVIAPVNPMFARLLDTNEIDLIPSPTYLVDKFIVSDSLAVIFGMPGACKSLLGVDWSLCVANSMSWMGHEVQGGDVLYVIAEGVRGIGKRKRAWQVDRGIETPKGVKWYPERVNLLDKGQVAQLIDLADALQPIMIVIDTLARSMPGADENSPAPMSEAIETMDRLKIATRAAVVAIHHTPKDGSSPRGHGSLLGAVDTAIKVTKVDGDITVTTEDKQKDDDPTTIAMRLRKIDDSAVLYPSNNMVAPDTLFSDMQLLQVIRENSGREGIASGVLQRLIDMPERTFHRARTRLADTGQIINVGTQKQPRWATKY